MEEGDGDAPGGGGDSPSRSRYGGPSPKGIMGMAYERPTESLMRMSMRAREEQDELHQQRASERAVDPALRNGGDVEILKKKLRQKYGSVTAGWREAVDVRRVHFVGQADWFKAMRDVGFGGNAKIAWNELSRGKGQVTLADLDPAAAQLLSEFYNAYTIEVGPLPGLIDDCDSLRVGKVRFLEKCATLAKSTGKGGRRNPVDLDRVFWSLQVVAGSVTTADCAWLAHYCQRGEKSAPSTPSSSKGDKPNKTELMAAAARRRDVKEFKKRLQHRFGGLIQAWRRLLDPEGNGACTMDHVELVVEALGMESDASELWEEICGSEADVLTLKDLCPEGEKAVEEFKQRCIDCFGSLTTAFEELVAERKPLVSREEFNKLCLEIKLEANKNLVFEFLDERGVGHILLASIDKKAAITACGSAALTEANMEHTDLEPLPLKAKHVDIRTRAAEQCAESQRPPEDQRSYREELLLVLQTRWESPIRAWGAVLDPEHKGKLSKEEFFVGCSVAGYTGSKTSLWKELGLKDTQSVRLRDIAPEVIEDCAYFKSLSGKQLGRIITAMEASQGPDAKKNGAVIKWEQFKDLCTRIGYKGSMKALMKHFDPAGVGYVNSKSLRYFHEEKKEEKAMAGLVRKHHERRQEEWREKLEGMKMAPTKELLARQNGLLTMGREKREDRTRPENERVKLIAKLSRKFGSIAKAWKRALNPSDTQELSMEAFLDGLKRAGILKPRPEQPDIDRYQKVFTYMISGDEDATGLRLYHLDSRLDDSLEELKSRCVDRYGSIWQAFEAFDPEGTGTISSKAFTAMCQEVKVTDGIHRMLHYFDPDSEHEIQLDNIDKEAADDAKDAADEKKEARLAKERRDERLKRTHMKSQPPDFGSRVGFEARKEDRQLESDQQVLKGLRQKLLKQYGNLVRGWRGVFDPDDEGSITFETFEGAMEDMGMEGKAADAWRALGLNPDATPSAKSRKKGKGKKEIDPNSLTLAKFVPGLERDLRDFSFRILERYGSFLAAFEEMSVNGSSALDRHGFFNVLQDCQFRGNHKRLFQFFSKNGQTVPFDILDLEAAQAFKKRHSKFSEDGEDEGEDGGEVPMTPLTASVVSVPRPDPAQVFREALVRKFGSMARAWRALDPECRAVITRQEFTRSVGATGYSGSPSNLWAALVGEEKTLSLRELDPDGFSQLVAFRHCCAGYFDSFDRTFAEDDGELRKRFSLEEFEQLCRKVGCPKPWDYLFQQLAVREAVGWPEVRFMEEQWDWQEENERPLRQPPKTPSAASPAYPPRPFGQGHMKTAMRPRRVTLSKSNSLPALTSSPLRSNWNDRHHIPEHKGNKDENVLHLMSYVNCQEQERVKRRIAQKMRQTPTLQWLAENFPGVGEFDSDEEY